jgi:hypothetical protein
MNFFRATANSFSPFPSLREAMPLSFRGCWAKNLAKEKVKPKIKSRWV